jgi:outer membrane protein assembly factor BamB
MLIYTEDISQTLTASGATVAVDLQTGQQIWRSTSMPQISFAYVYDAEDPNQHGVWPPMLVAASGSNWRVFDAFSATPLFNVTNVPGQGFFGLSSNAAKMMGVEGEYLIGLLTNYGDSENPNWYLQEWNSSRLWDNLYSGPSTTPTIPPPITDGSDPSLYDYNVSLPWLNTATLNDAPIGSMTVLGGVQGDILLAYAGNFPSEGNRFFGVQSSDPYETFGINLNATSNAIGTELWHNLLQAPAGDLTVTWGCLDPVNNVFALEYRETMQYIGFSLLTGEKIWGPTVAQADLDYYGCQASGSLATTTAYGKIYSSAYAGIVYCYDTTDGSILWTFGNGDTADNSTNSGLETAFGHYPTFVNAIGNGVVYTISSEHTEETPIYKGAVARGLNATTGKQIWALSAYTGEFLTGSYAIADGYSTLYNGYDNQIYSVGKGPSATTVSVPHAGLAFGQSVVISGTVMDVSAGTTQEEQAARFPNGVPCASDASMTDWMGYVYQQQPCPASFTGVPVTLSVYDSNGNTYPIGTAVTDGSGTYSLTWTPTISGNYTVYATFAGTNGYWYSSAEDHFTVMEEPVATPPPTSQPASLADIYILPMSIAIIIAIIVVGAVLILMLRKR